jgi:predicted oxidoreductase
MERRKIHPNGPEFSRIVAGVWKWPDETVTERCLMAALDAGITTFDHADIYGGYTLEKIFGNVLRNNASLRSRLELVTKCGIALVNHNRPAHIVKHYNTSYEHIIASVDQSLQNLHTDYIDLLLLHRPDPLLHGEEVAEAFDELERSGKVLHFGVSNFSSRQFEMLQSFLPMTLVTNQLEISLFRNEYLFEGTVDTLITHRASPMAWSPLGSGKFFSNHEQMHGLQVLADRYRASIAQLLFAWLLAHPSAIFPITGTTKPERLREAAASLAIPLERQDWFEMLKLIRSHDVA